MEKTTKKAEYRSSIRSRMLIQSALLDLMAEKDISKITVIDVVNRANINRGTFYAHYSDLNDVLEQISNRTIERMPSLTGYTQAATWARAPLTSTRHIRQAPISLMSFR